MRPLKFKSAAFSNKKKQIEILYTNGKQARIHFGSVGIKKLIKEIKVDWETNGKSLKIKFEDGSVHYLPYDQPLLIARDPEILLQIHIERIIAKIKDAITWIGRTNHTFTGKRGRICQSDQRLNQGLMNPGRPAAPSQALCYFEGPG